jgi:uncharacterized membrane protein (UPF0127 family)
VLKHEQDIAVNITDNEALKIEEFTLYVAVSRVKRNRGLMNGS